VHQGIGKALKLDVAVGTLLLALLACLTMFGVRRRMRPLEDMVETSSAIAEGDLTRRVPSSHHPTHEVEQLRLALNSMLHQVESAYRTRERSAAQLRRFVADASHELRTPLSAIRGYLQLYDKGMLTEPAERRRAWDRMNAEVDRMGRLVDELLTLARLDQRPRLRPRNVDVVRLVRDAAEDLRAQQPERPVAVDADGSVLVPADESGLRQVLGNLVTNVRVHTPADAPVRLGVARADGVVQLCVADKGPGLADEDAARVFDRFFRAGGGAGSGLGMAIVQGVVEAHGGEVSVRTDPGEGFAVTVTLPARSLS
jgi:two-component system OmpR family sensor kinase